MRRQKVTIEDGRVVDVKTENFDRSKIRDDFNELVEDINDGLENLGDQIVKEVDKAKRKMRK